MSELQLGLLAIGALVVVAVLAYNKWQELRYRKLAERSFGAGHEDVLMGLGRADPANAGEPSDPQVENLLAPSMTDERWEPTMDPVVVPVVPAPDTASEPRASEPRASEPRFEPPPSPITSQAASPPASVMKDWPVLSSGSQ